MAQCLISLLPHFATAIYGEKINQGEIFREKYFYFKIKFYKFISIIDI
jgi:hypothetical protein